MWLALTFLIPHTLQQTETNITHNFSGHRNCCVAPYILHIGSTLSQLDQLLQIGPRVGVIYYRCSSTHNNTLKVLQSKLNAASLT